MNFDLFSINWFQTEVKKFSDAHEEKEPVFQTLSNSEGMIELSGNKVTRVWYLDYSDLADSVKGKRC